LDGAPVGRAGAAWQVQSECTASLDAPTRGSSLLLGVAAAAWCCALGGTRRRGDTRLGLLGGEAGRRRHGVMSELWLCRVSQVGSQRPVTYDGTRELLMAVSVAASRTRTCVPAMQCCPTCAGSIRRRQAERESPWTTPHRLRSAPRCWIHHEPRFPPNRSYREVAQ